MHVGHPCTPGVPQPARLGAPSPWAGHPCPPATMCQELQVCPCPHIRHSCKCALCVDLLMGSLLSSVHVPPPLLSSLLSHRPLSLCLLGSWLPPASLPARPVLVSACLPVCSSLTGWQPLSLVVCLLSWLFARHSLSSHLSPRLPVSVTFLAFVSWFVYLPGPAMLPYLGSPLTFLLSMFLPLCMPAKSGIFCSPVRPACSAVAGRPPAPSSARLIFLGCTSTWAPSASSDPLPVHGGGLTTPKLSATPSP